MFVAISAAGSFRTDDAGKTWQPINRGLNSEYIPDPNAEVGHCVHRIAMHPTRPNVLFMQKHWDVMRSDDAGDSWHEVSGDLPSDFRLSHRCACPRAGDHLCRAHQERLGTLPARRQAARLPQPHRRQRVGGTDQGLPQQDCYVNILRDAMAVDAARSVRYLLRHHRRPGVRVGRRRRSLGARSCATCRPVLSVEVQTLP
jgi:hypothetical protein